MITVHLCSETQPINGYIRTKCGTEAPMAAVVDDDVPAVNCADCQRGESPNMLRKPKRKAWALGFREVELSRCPFEVLGA